MEISDLTGSPPEAFGNFSVTPERQNDSDGILTARYQLLCRKCGGDVFTLDEVLSGSHGAAGIDATCSACGQVGTVFHASQHGYDGRLGHLRFLQEITGRQSLCDYDGEPVGAAQIACDVSYSIDPNEIATIAAEEGLPPQDLFDGFTLLARKSQSDSWRSAWDYECA